MRCYIFPLLGMLSTYHCLAKPTLSTITSVKRDALADCDGGTYSGSYTDGQGTYVTSDSISHPYVFPAIRKCWHDYFTVDGSISYGPWRQSTGDLYCTGTAPSCTNTELNGTQVCQTRSTSISTEVSGSITDQVSEGLVPGLSVSETITFELSNQQCYTVSDANACSWNDDQCHVVWSQQQMANAAGYWRKRCNLGGGDQTQCMSDWTMSTPTTFTNFGCGSKCGDSNYCGNTDGSSCPSVLLSTANGS